ncbi:hypothetical protein AB2B41_06990 [Marimonas sp. MJW-29]|uniref:Stereocilin n=1 Tax=Sulfitobacter sediminis TaxID=3234186 RepID=A0ABV3RK51_9RHOB
MPEEPRPTPGPSESPQPTDPSPTPGTPEFPEPENLPEDPAGDPFDAENPSL